MSYEYGIFTYEGLLVGGYWSVAEAEADLPNHAEGYDDGDLSVEMICPDHEEQSHNSCEECATDYGDDGPEDDEDDDEQGDGLE